jgi:biotin carboxyl carrier protein
MKDIEILEVRDDEAELRINGRTHIVPYVIQGATVHFAFDGETYAIEVGEKSARTRSRHRDHSTEAPMPGVVLKILVKQGDVVAKGAPLLILEAMKMEHQIVAGHEATVLSINCNEGEMVQPGVELVTLSDENPR